MSHKGNLIVQLFWRMGLTMLVAMVLVVAVLLYEFQNKIDTLRDRSLNGQLEDVLRHLRWHDGAPVLELPASLEFAYRNREKNFRYVVFDDAGTVLLSMPAADEPLYFPGDTGSGLAGLFRTVDPESGQVYLGATHRVVNAGKVVWVQTAQSQSHTDVLAETFFEEVAGKILWVGTLIFIAILVVTYWTLRRVMAPIVAVSQEAAAIGPDKLDQRLSLDNVPSELTPLLDAVNSGLDRLEEAYRLQREFTANAAHEIRTPIAVLQAHLQTLDDKKTAESLLEELSQLGRLVSQLLKLAQMDNLALSPAQTADLHAVAVDIAGRMVPVAIAQDKTLAVSGTESTPVNGDPEAIGMALRNLVENALAHSPAGGEVEIHVGPGPTLSVTDQGKGVEPALRTKIFERFWRAERKSNSGAGLGLSIVSRIVAAHNAEITVGDAPGGGAKFTIKFSSFRTHCKGAVR